MDFTEITRDEVGEVLEEYPYALKISFKNNNGFMRIEYSQTDKSKDLPKIKEMFGGTIELNREDVETIDNILEPYKKYGDGSHCRNVEDDSRPHLFDRSIAQYPPLLGDPKSYTMNHRFGCCWYLNVPNQFNFYKRREVMIEKISNGYYIVNIEMDRTRGYDDFYLIYNLEDLKKLIKERVLSSFN